MTQVPIAGSATVPNLLSTSREGNGSITHPSAESSTITPGSTSSNNTFLMPVSPAKGRRDGEEGYRPKVSKTTGQRPACLVNASVTYCGDNQVIVFGGFDQYTDEVYNHVLKLDLATLQWNLVDNYGDIPGVRMGHTATLYQGDKLLIYGGENEHRTYLSDIIIFEVKSAHWVQPVVHGPIPTGRARHAAALHEDKLFIVGGVTGQNNCVLDDICYLDLKTWTWSKTWKFVGRFDHTAWVWGDRLWVFGGLGEDMERGGEMWWLDVKGNPAFETPTPLGPSDCQVPSGRPAIRSGATPGTSYTLGTSGYAANSSSVQTNPSPSVRPASAPIAPGAISSLKFSSNPYLPSQSSGTHFHVYLSGSLLDFVTPASTTRSSDCGLSVLDLESLRWQKLVEGAELFNPAYRWHYCAMSDDGTKAWLLGCSVDFHNGDGGSFEEYLSHVMPIDLTKFGLLSNDFVPKLPSISRKDGPFERFASSPSSGLGVDLALLFDRSPHLGSGADFVVTGERDEESADDDDTMSASYQAGREKHWLTSSANTSVPIHVHKLILQARWPHFGRLYASQMAEFHTKKMHIPEPYSVVRAFLYYLYTDSIAHHPEYCSSLADVAGLLVMANVYDLPRLRLLCVNRLGKELDVDHAAIIWERASAANEEWLGRRAASYCHLHWGRVVRTEGFKTLSRQSLMDLCAEVDVEGRVVGGEEIEIETESSAKFGFTGVGIHRSGRHLVGATNQLTEEMEEVDVEDEGMEMS
ncbi:MAG: hypothetical protein M1837_002087 [Sclerophora amabilis]|nr:MAG: hypothetical protein M1837_002087 [Sclerophora amabilis]